jgi:mannose-6-phosphate isomerase-like protein (cupin superfamily)
MLKPIRRITTGIHHKTSESTIFSEEKVDILIPYSQFPCFKLQNIFYTEDSLQSLKTRHLNKPYDIELPPGAMRFLKIRMPTITEMAADLKAAGQDIPKDWKKYNLHSTDSIDYIYVLSGKITCIVGEQQLQLSEGDFLAQVGPEHTWVNEHNEPCYFLGVMIGIEPSGNHKKMMVE